MDRRNLKNNQNYRRNLNKNQNYRRNNRKNDDSLKEEMKELIEEFKETFVKAKKIVEETIEEMMIV